MLVGATSGAAIVIRGGGVVLFVSIHPPRLATQLSLSRKYFTTYTDPTVDMDLLVTSISRLYSLVV